MQMIYLQKIHSRYQQSRVSSREVITQMCTSAPTSCASYVVPSSDSDLIDLYVLRLNGEGFILKLSSCSLGREAHRLVSKQLQPKKGEQLTLQYLGAQLMLHQTLQEQGIVSKAATLSCTLFRQTCTQSGVSSRGKVPQSLRGSLFYRCSRRSLVHLL